MCDTVVVVRPDRVYFAKNSDRDANEAQVLTWVPAATHPPGTALRCTWIEIPQAPQTQAVLLSRPFWTWGAEIGANAAGVVIGNEAVFTNQPDGPPALTGMDLVRLGLERGRTAREAADVIVGLLEQHGQGGGCGLENRRFTYHNSFLIADPEQAWHLETAGRRWALARVTGACSISNALRLSPFAEQHAERLGVKTSVAAARARQARTAALAAEVEDRAQLRALLRDHGGEGGPRWRWHNGGLSTVCMHGGGLLAASQTTGSWVSELGPDGARHQATGTAAPCLSLYKPVAVDQPVDLGPAPTERADPRSLWWRWEALHRGALPDLPAALARLSAAQRATEARWDAEGTPSTQAFAEADALLDAWLAELTPSPDTRPWHARWYWSRRARLADPAR